MNTAESNGQNPGPKTQVTTLPARESVVNAQVVTLLNIAGTMMGIILQGKNRTEGGEIDSGAALAAETTFISVCNRLDRIVADDSRWNMDLLQTLEQSLTTVYRKHAECLDAQIAAAREVNTPHYIYRPTLYKLRDGNFAAILGSVDDLDNAIAAVGDSPRAALLAFDMLFEGKIPQHLFEWLQQRRDAIERGDETLPEPPKTKRKGKK